MSLQSRILYDKRDRLSYKLYGRSYSELRYWEQEEIDNRFNYDSRIHKKRF